MTAADNHLFLAGKLSAIRVAIEDAAATADAHRKPATAKLIRNAIYQINAADTWSTEEIAAPLKSKR